MHYAFPVTLAVAIPPARLIIVTLAVEVHTFASVTVTVYVPAIFPEMVELTEPVFHK